MASQLLVLFSFTSTHKQFPPNWNSPTPNLVLAFILTDAHDRPLTQAWNEALKLDKTPTSPRLIQCGDIPTAS